MQRCLAYIDIRSYQVFNQSNDSVDFLRSGVKTIEKYFFGYVSGIDGITALFDRICQRSWSFPDRNG
jgi:hypothetical protein